MTNIVLDTNVLVDLLSKDNDVINEFINRIKETVFIPSLVYDEFYNRFEKRDKGYKESKEIYDSNIEIKNVKNKLVNDFFEEIFRNLKGIKKNYMIEFNKLDNFIKRKKEKQKELIRIITEIRRMYY